MPTFRSLLKIIWGHKAYIAIYLVLMNLMGVLIGASASNDQPASAFSYDPTRVAVIDRDGSRLSRGLKDAVLAQGDHRELADDVRAIQDAVARGTVSYILVIPEGWGEKLVAASRAGASAPGLEAYVSYKSGAGALMQASVTSYASGLYGYVATTGFDQDGIVAHVNEAMKSEVETSLIPQATTPLPKSFQTYCMFATYPLFASVTVCIAILMTRLSGRAIRERRMGAPTTARRRNLRLYAACLTVGLFAWALTSLLGVVLFARQSLLESPALVTLSVLGLLVYALVSTCVGFLLGQLGASENAANAVAVILGMAMSFMGGAWIDLGMLPSAVVAAAHFVPSFWCTQVITGASAPSEVSLLTIAPLLGSLGVAMLYALAILLVALVVGRSRGMAEL